MKKIIKTKDPVNQSVISLENENGLETIGLMNSSAWHVDPKHLIFTLSRYKFVAKMLSGKESVAEIGCGARIVKQEVGKLTITDYDSYFIKRFKDIASEEWPISAVEHNILFGPLKKKFDAIYSLDVFEHISKDDEHLFIRNIVQSINDSGVLILGMPSIESQEFASSQPVKKDMLIASQARN
jgi:cyclopropane fatty-acyl-phospholipid synthase-like methyltransferase